MSAKKKRVPIHYVNNDELLTAMIAYRNQVQENQKQDLPSPRIPEFVGESIMKIATHLAMKSNFSKYPFIDDMIFDGIENCLQYIDNFDPDKSKNPFAYFTQIIYYAFLRRIQKEKAYLYTKHAVTSMMEINSITSDRQAGDVTSYREEKLHGEWSNEQMLRFMEEFETKKRKSRKPKKEKDANSTDK